MLSCSQKSVFNLGRYLKVGQHQQRLFKVSVDRFYEFVNPILTFRTHKPLIDRGTPQASSVTVRWITSKALEGLKLIQSCLEAGISAFHVKS